MRKLIKILVATMLVAVSVTSCVEVDNGYKGVAYKPYSGGLDPKQVYPEGVDMGISWLWNDMITYDCRQKTTDIQAELLDVNSMTVGVTASVFHRVIPTKIGYLHLEKGLDYEKTYIVPVFEGCLKNIIGKYTAQEIVSSKRDVVQKEIKQLLDTAFMKNYIQCDDIIIRDVNLPQSINNAIVAKQVQDEKNLLAEKMKKEKQNLAEAQIAEAKGQYEASVFDAKRKAILSQPKMLELKKLENEALMWKGFLQHGHSPFGNNNMFGVTPAVVKGLK